MANDMRRNHEAMMAEARRANAARATITLPWERGWLNTILGTGTVISMGFLEVPRWAGPVPPTPWDRYRDVDDVSEAEEGEGVKADGAVAMKKDRLQQSRKTKKKAGERGATSGPKEE